MRRATVRSNSVANTVRDLLTHQAQKHQRHLDDVREGDRVKTSEDGVDDGHSGRDPNTDLVGQIEDHGHGGACSVHKHTGMRMNTSESDSNVCVCVWLYPRKSSIQGRRQLH